MITLIGKIIILIRRIIEKCISLYQLSIMPHGIGCEIRGGNSSFLGPSGNITLGNYVTIGTHSTFMATDAKITIGNKVLFGPHVFIITGNHQVNQIGKFITDVQLKTEHCDEDVVIEDDVWIGAGAIILKGVRISKGSIIGAGSVVTRNTQPYSINAGIPCHFIKMRFSPKEIEEHERLLNICNPNCGL